MRYKHFITEVFAFIGSLVFIYFLSTAPSFGLTITAIAVWFTWYVLAFTQTVSSRKIKTSMRTTLALNAVMILGGMGLLYAGYSAGDSVDKFPFSVTCMTYVGLCYFITRRLIFGADD